MNRFFKIIKIVVFYIGKFFDRIKPIIFSISSILTSLFFIVASSYIILCLIGLNYLEQIYHVPFTTLLTAIYVVFSYNYYGQKIYLENKEKLLMPGVWIEEINKNSKIINDQHKSYSDVQEMIYNFKDILISKEDLIERYQQGYDYKIQKNFLLRFIKLSRMIEDCKGKSDEELKKSVKNISLLFEDAMEEYGIEIIPEDLIIGKEFIGLGALVQDSPTKVTTSIESEDGIVFQINKNGYKLVDAEKLTIITGAKVTVMQYSK